MCSERKGFLFIYSDILLILPNRLIRYIPHRPTIVYTILESQLKLPKRNATRIVYTLVGLCGLYLLSFFGRVRGMSE